MELENFLRLRRAVQIIGLPITAVLGQPQMCGLLDYRLLASPGCVDYWITDYWASPKCADYWITGPGNPCRGPNVCVAAIT